MHKPTLRKSKGRQKNSLAAIIISVTLIHCRAVAVAFAVARHSERSEESLYFAFAVAFCFSILQLFFCCRPQRDLLFAVVGPMSSPKTTQPYTHQQHTSAE